ncbi:spore coat CotO family protein [Virgibacillus necropolis]|uniref:CotO family spore coat protein n=1 Tax=Virgibacillus necropolis TaxID=163877 RepID=UPI003850F437
MDKQKKFAKSPLLYIHQPEVSNPKAPMQSNYSTPKNKKEAETPKAQKVNTRPIQRDYIAQKTNSGAGEDEGSSTDLIDSSKEEVEEQPKAQSNKKFNNMTIQEKIDYFLSKPTHIPRMKCEVKTEEKSFRGTIQDVEEDQVLMRVGRRTSMTKIAIESIQDIRLLGF